MKDIQKKVKKITNKEIANMDLTALNDAITKCATSMFQLRLALTTSEKFKSSHLIGVQRKNIARILTHKRRIGK